MQFQVLQRLQQEAEEERNEVSPSANIENDTQKIFSTGLMGDDKANESNAQENTGEYLDPVGLVSNSPDPSSESNNKQISLSARLLIQDDSSSDLFSLQAARVCFTSRAALAWEKITSHLLKHDCWSRLGDLAKKISSLPKEVCVLYERVEAKYTTKLDEATKLQFYKEFVRTTLGASMLHTEKVVTTKLFPFPLAALPWPASVVNSAAWAYRRRACCGAWAWENTSAAWSFACFCLAAKTAPAAMIIRRVLGPKDSPSQSHARVSGRQIHLGTITSHSLEPPHPPRHTYTNKNARFDRTPR